jgi:glucose-6-phosphate 1-dehydrogenase
MRAVLIRHFHGGGTWGVSKALPPLPPRVPSHSLLRSMPDAASSQSRPSVQLQLAPPAIFIIFGATGDLSRRKILPALYQLHKLGLTVAGSAILGVARDDGMDDDKFRQLAAESVGSPDDASVQKWVNTHLFYQKIGAGSPDDFQALRKRIEEIETKLDLDIQNRAFYLALPPAAFTPTVEGLRNAGLNRSSGWTRIVIEKPFGRDLASARALNAEIHKCFDESQIYRIDHYLGKETVQNIMVFRFANAMFESLWNRDHIESITTPWPRS